MFIPNAKRYDSDRLELYVLEDFLNAEECARVGDVVEAHIRATGGLESAADTGEKPIAFDLSMVDDAEIEDIDRRACALLGLSTAYSEGIKANVLEAGKAYPSAADALDPADANYDRFAGVRGQRTWTFRAYLDDVENGGAIRFGDLDMTIIPRRGTAVIWNNMDPSGRPNCAAVYQDMPLASGRRTVITKHFRANGDGAMIAREPNENIPNYSKTGFAKVAMPGDLHQRLLNFYRYAEAGAKTERVEGEFVRNPTGAASALIELPNDLKSQIHAAVQPILEKWSGQELDPTFVYGIRRYHRYSTLEMHRDKLETHILSAILMVTQKVNDEWPLVIEDNAYRRHEVIAAPGEMVLYEGGRLDHGRPEPLNGEYFCNLYVHFMPRGYVAPAGTGAGDDDNLAALGSTEGDPGASGKGAKDDRLHSLGDLLAGRVEGTKSLDGDWRGWIDENLDRKCEPKGIFDILVDHGFRIDEIKAAMGADFPVVDEALAEQEIDYASLSVPRITRTVNGSAVERIQTDKLQLFVIDDFLNEAECDGLMALLQAHLRPSTITNEDEADTDFRTSRTCDLSLLESPIVDAVDEKIARTLGICLPYSEGIQAQHYAVGQEFKRHTDFFAPNSGEYEMHAAERGNRSWTFVVYLNDVLKGGGTKFYSIDKTIEPKRGRAAIWNNLYPDGRPNPDTLHAGLPVEEGDKVIITKWFRVKGKGPVLYDG